MSCKKQVTVLRSNLGLSGDLSAERTAIVPLLAHKVPLSDFSFRLTGYWLFSRIL